MDGRQISNPFSTGSGGGHFEAHVQATFVLLMLSGGFAPGMPNWPIKKIKLQGRFEGFDTDDLIVFVEQPGSDQKRKILGQIKHSIKISKNDQIFREVISAAWRDFNNSELFTKGKDAIALITGPLTLTDVNDVRTILEWSRHSENADEFIRKVQLTNFSSQKKQDKLQAFRSNLILANDGKTVTDEGLFEFLRHFHLLGYDLDIKAGVTLSLLHSIMGQVSRQESSNLWPRIVDEVQSTNKNAGTISMETLPDDLKAAFAPPRYASMPEEFSVKPSPSEKTDLGYLAHNPSLVVANIIGSWSEVNEADIEVIQTLINEDFESWVTKIREILHKPESPLRLKNRLWMVSERERLWHALEARIFDSTLDSFKDCAVKVLTERSSIFDIPVEERYTSTIFRKPLQYSAELRKGLAETLALLGNYSKSLPNASLGKAEQIASTAVREILRDSDFGLWGTLNQLLPTIAEAAPDVFLSQVEYALQQNPCPFDEVFAQESNGITGGNYLTGLLWALETLAWEERLLVRVCVALGELAANDPGGNWGNRPDDSLLRILLPWLPQTTAPLQKRQAALRTLRREVPAVAWKLLLNLLPGQFRTTHETHKPKWRNKTTSKWEKKVTQKEYWEQVSFYAELAVSMAATDNARLVEVVSLMDKLPEPAFDKVLNLLTSEAILTQSEEERQELWESMMSITGKHRRNSDESWALNIDMLSRAESVTQLLAPTAPALLYRRLFNEHALDLYEDCEDWDDQWQKLSEKRQGAVDEILRHGGVEATIEFAIRVKSPDVVGNILGSIAESDLDDFVFPELLRTENSKLKVFVSGYVWSRQNRYGWPWVDCLDKASWSISEIIRFLGFLPFTKETWERAAILLRDHESEYWTSANVNPYHAQDEISAAIDKLVLYGRPRAAIDCLYRILGDGDKFDTEQTIRVLLASVSSDEPVGNHEQHHIIKIIKALQNNHGTDPEGLFRVEWAYLPILRGYGKAGPKLLESRLASDPAFFCELIRLIYRSRNEGQAIKVATEKHIVLAKNAWSLLYDWRTPPGTQPDGSFSEEKFRSWLEDVKSLCLETGHLDVALTHVGNVLTHAPSDSQGLWINHAVAEALNTKDAEALRGGLSQGFYNSRGVHWIDPTGKPERKLASIYRQKAEEVENEGYHRLAVTMRGLADSYDQDADHIVSDHQH